MITTKKLKDGWPLVPLLLVIILSASCKKYLEAIPDKSLTVPQNLKELQGLLDNPELNLGFPSAGDLASDNMYLPTEDWNYFFFLNDRLAYIWDKDTDLAQDWLPAYQRVFISNVALDGLQKFEEYSGQDDFKNIRGSALFYRAIIFYELAQLFAPPYSTAVASQPYGIPLKTSSDIGETTVRSTVEETYSKIIGDVKESLRLLPPLPAYSTRPSKAAAYALLARTYLVMNDYANAEKYADSSLQLQAEIINYNVPLYVDTTAETPFKRMNKEVIFHSVTRPIVELLRSKVDTNLAKSYHTNDIRKKAFFKLNPDGSFHFKGSYDGTLSVTFFNGITVSEMYLIRAECRARANRMAEAVADLNTLLFNRWADGTFTPITASSSSEALNIVLRERRKELCFRGSLRWSDLRRLNQDPNFAINLARNVNGQTYTLDANDKRYTFLIPEDVIDKSGVVQNPR